MHPVVAQIRDLPIEEKMRIVEELWDDIAAAPAAVALTPEYWAELDRRFAELDADPDAGLTDEEVWSQIRMPHAP
jgi:putative addiction module component (TIGR02574 family)